MGLMNVNRALSVGRNRVAVEGSFRPNGATGVVTGSVKGKGFSIARAGAGLYTVTFSEKANALDSVTAGVREAAGTPTFVQIGDYSASNKTLQLRVMQAATAGVTEGKGFIPIDIMAARELGGTTTFPDLSDTEATDTFAAGGYLALDSTPTLTRKNGTTDRMPIVTWAAADVQEIALPAIPIPPDIAVDSDVTVHALLEGYNAGAIADSGKTVDCLAFYHKAGATYAADTEMGGNFTLPDDKKVNELAVTLDEADIGTTGVTGHPGMLSLSLLPGAHGNDGIILHGMWLEYTLVDWATTGQVFTATDLAADVDNVVNFRALFRNSNVDA